MVKDTEKFHDMDPYVEDHSIYFPNLDLHITLFIHSTLPYFLTSKPLIAVLEGIYEIHLMNPEGRWNPGSDT